jgi:thymidylate synthase
VLVTNNTDVAYQQLIDKIFTEGKLRGDRTGTGTWSIFSHSLEIDMSDGFPLLTTKKMFTKGIIHELLWFLNGDTNIRYLVKNGVNIWTPDAYREYKKYAEAEEEPNYFLHVDDPMGNCTRIMNMEEFKHAIINDSKFAEKFGELGPIYGKQWVSWGEIYKKPSGWNHGAPTHFKSVGHNQIQKALDLLKHNPESRRIIVSAWNVEDLPEMALPPCHWAFELYTEELTPRERMNISTNYGNTNNIEANWDVSEDLINHMCDKWDVPTRRLHLKWHQRSVDVGLGLPFNIASYAFLLHMFAQQVNMVPGTLVGDLTNVHIYKNHINALKEQISRDPLLLPKLELKKAENIFSYQFSDFNILDYKSHDKLPMNISV